MDIFAFLLAPIAFGAFFGFVFSFVPSIVFLVLVSAVGGGGAFWVFVASFNEAQGIFIGFPVLLMGFGFVASLWITYAIRARCSSRA
ncbi:MAG: hypothetical protein HYT29_00940 [Parcubacteria group bacterium]|nr:hypothetical protein [Parcubacteria group bacterium]